MTQSLFLFLHPTFIDTNTPVCLRSLFQPLLFLVLLSQGQDLPRQSMWVPSELGTCSFSPQGQSPWPLALGGKVLTAVSLRSHTGPHQTVAGTQQLDHPQSRPMFRGKGLLRQGRNIKPPYGLPAESPGRQRPSRKGKKQPKQLNKCTGGSWQTEEATHRANFRLRVMCSAPSRAQALLAPGWEDTHAHTSLGQTPRWQC